MIEPPIDERYERAAEVMAAIAERDEAVALLRHVENTCGCAGVDIDAIVTFLAKIKEGK